MAVNKKHIGYVIEGLLYIALIWFAAVMLSGCMTQQKAVNYLSKNNALPHVCADSFPVKADTVIKEGETIETVEVWTDTLYVTDTIDNTSLPDTIEKLKVMTRVVTKHRVDTLVQSKVDSARVKALQVIIAKQVSDYDKIAADRYQWKDKAKARGRNQFISFGFNILLILGIGFILGRKIKMP